MKEKIYVVDTSVTAKLFLVEEQREKAKQVYQQAIRKKITLFAPELTYYELNSVLTKTSMPLEDIKKYLLFFEEQIKNKTITIVPSSLEILNKAEIANLDTKGKGDISSFDAIFHALALLKNAYHC
jgi:predicted nucleic acid-binding protein